MKVLVTGASGFVGAHTTAALVEKGHAVRAFVRSPEKLTRALEPLGAPTVETVVGDVLDREAVAAAVDGCDAVVNAASVYALGSRQPTEMADVNLNGTENVLAAAVAAGCDPAIHVSSYVALLPSPGPIPADPPVGRPAGNPYCDSKIASEEVARRFQSEGAPVVTTYPGQIFGPHDPGGGEMVSMTRLFLDSRMPPGLAGSIGIVDVGWLARLHAALVVPGQGPRRFVVPGTHVAWTDLGRALYAAAGREPPRFLPTPYAVASLAGRVGQLISRRTKLNVPVNAEGPWISKHWQPGDDHLARALIGDPPPLAETLEVAVAWMNEAGYLD